MSYSDDDLNQAVKAGVLTTKDVNAFRDFISIRQNTKISSEEHFRLISSFNDIFVSIAILLVLFAAWYLGAEIADSVGGLVSAVLAWGLAEYFSRIRRMALPSILLLLGFVISVYFILPINDDDWVFVRIIMSIGAAALHWWRFKIPITIAAGMAAFAFLAVAVLLEPDIDLLLDGGAPLIMALGVITLAKAIWWDSINPLRTTRHADVAFWLHILSALLIVHPLFSMIDEFDTVTGASLVFALYAGLTILSVILDRRALMVSALGYALYAASSVFTNANHDELAYAFAAVTIGGGLLMLSALWSHVRRVILRLLPVAVTNKLPPA
ncbi:MAG: hypothetical protein ACON49_06695 [Candidatus Puniceispirillaceae bacterium]